MKSKKDIGGSDNWYAEEKERESKISAWDIDEGKKLAQGHQAFHQGSKPKRQRNNGTSDPFFVLNLILFSLLIPFSTAVQDHSLLPMMILFLFLATGVIIWETVFKRFPPRWYFILALILTILSEILALRKVF